MLLLDINNSVIGRYRRPITTSVTIVQIGIYRKLDIASGHPEAVQNAEQLQLLRMERVSICGIQVLRIIEETPPDLFEHEGFERWTGI